MAKRILIYKLDYLGFYLILLEIEEKTPNVLKHYGNSGKIW